MGIDRREFIKGISSAGAVALGSLAWPAKLWAATGASVAAGRAKEKQWLTKLVDIILPATEKTPAASAVNVPAYLQKVMGGEVPRFKKFRRSSYYRQAYEKLFSVLDVRSKTAHQKNFLELDAPASAMLLTELAKDVGAQVGYRTAGMSDVKNLSDSQLVAMLRNHTVQGYFADPSYGGNKDYKAWEAIGYICHVNYPGDQSSCAAPEHAHEH